MSQHAKDAQYSVSASSEIASWDAEERLIFAARAQAEATLALAEEQRTANLIAILGGPEVQLFAEEHLFDKRYLPLLAELKDRLGIA